MSTKCLRRAQGRVEVLDSTKAGGHVDTSCDQSWTLVTTTNPVELATPAKHLFISNKHIRWADPRQVKGIWCTFCLVHISFLIHSAIRLTPTIRFKVKDSRFDSQFDSQFDLQFDSEFDSEFATFYLIHFLILHAFGFDTLLY